MRKSHFNWRIITVAGPLSVLPVLSPVHRSVRWGGSHCDRSGKLPSSLSILLPLAHPCRVCTNRSCVKWSSCHSHMVYVTTLRTTTQAFPQLQFHLLFTICLDAHGPDLILGWMKQGAVWACFLGIINVPFLKIIIMSLNHKITNKILYLFYFIVFNIFFLYFFLLLLLEKWLVTSLTCHSTSDEEVTGMFSYNLFCSLPPADLHDGYHL